MSHHFDTPTGREDPRINVCDFYLFSGRAGTTVMAMTVNADAGISAPETFRDEGVYAFRFDLNGMRVRRSLSRYCSVPWRTRTATSTNTSKKCGYLGRPEPMP